VQRVSILLKEFVLSTFKKLATEYYKWPTDKLLIKSRNNIMLTGECDTPHCHAGVDMVGVYYVKAPDNCGDIHLLDSRGSVPTNWKDPNICNDGSENNRSGRISYRIKPEEGTLIFFPGYVIHSVDTNLNDDTRISIVFEIKINYQIGE
jgi:uncharacterized protein (TIGR02466 family)